MGNLSIDGLAQGVTEQSATAMGTQGVIYEDNSGKKYRYGYFSAYCSAYFNTVCYEQADGVLKLTKCAATSTTMHNGGLTLRNMSAGYYGFTLVKGNGEAYVASSVAAAAPLSAASASSAGVLAAKIAGIAEIVAQCVDTGQGEGTTTTVHMCIVE